MTRETKSFLPKEIGGVKVPKKVRKGPLGELLASPDGIRLLAEAVAERRRAKPEKPPAEAKWPELAPGSEDRPQGVA